MDAELRMMQRAAASGDPEALLRLARMHHRSDAPLKLNKDDLSNLLLWSCQDGWVPRVAIPVNVSLLNYLSIYLTRVIRCVAGCSNNLCEHGRVELYKSTRRTKNGDLSCSHLHKTISKARECSKRRARAIILSYVKNGNFTYRIFDLGLIAS